MDHAADTRNSPSPPGDCHAQNAHPDPRLPAADGVRGRGVGDSCAGLTAGCRNTDRCCSFPGTSAECGSPCARAAPILSADDRRLIRDAQRAALSESRTDAIARAQSAIAAGCSEAESRARAGARARACVDDPDGRADLPRHGLDCADAGRVRPVGLPLGLAAGDDRRSVPINLGIRPGWIAGHGRFLSSLRRRIQSDGDAGSGSASADDVDDSRRPSDRGGSALGQGDDGAGHGLRVAWGLLWIALALVLLAPILTLSGCATRPEPAPLPVVEPAPIAAPSHPLIRETATPVVTPIWLSEPDGETLARLYDLRPLGGGLCLVVNGGVSCDWRAK